MMSGEIQKKANGNDFAALGKLSINQKSSKTSSETKKNKIIVDSWEDDTILYEKEEQSPVSPQQPATFPSAPPPTPISPSDQYTYQNFENPYGFIVDRKLDAGMERKPTKRPDKTDAIAKRLISGALNIKPPKKTDEQRAYEEAMKAKEISRRIKEKHASLKAQEDTERARQAFWND